MADNDEVILAGKKLLFAHLAWWFVFLAYTTFSFFSEWYWYQRWGNEYFALDAYQMFALNVLGYILAIFLFWKRSNNWMVIVTSMAIVVITGFINREHAGPFWYYVFNNGWGNLETLNDSALIQAGYFSIPFDFIMFTIYSYGILVFPKGKWLFPKARWIFIGSLIFYIASIGLQYAELASFDITMPFSIVAAGAQIIHYRNTESPTQRQQVKWILVFFGLIVLTTVLDRIVYTLPDNFTETFYFLYDLFYWATPFLYLCFLFAVSFSVIRYRLWDIDNLINKTLVYSLLTGSLGLLGVASTAVLNYFIKNVVGEESSIWAIVISVLPVAAAFNPVREYLQSFVDRFFKPEEINFSDYFVEFRADVRELLGVERIVQIVAKQVKKQLNVEFANIYIINEVDALCLVHSTIRGESTPFAVDAPILSKLMNGQLITAAESDPYSLLVPLVVARPRYPDFLGVIVLGRRLSGMGYSTQVLGNLKKLGEDAGQAIYLAQLSEQSKQKAFA